MKRSLALVPALLALAAAAALAGNHQGSPSALCKEQRKQMGAADFVSTYAPGKSMKAAMDACLARQTQVQSHEAKNAAHECKALRAQMGAEAFADAYGTNENKRNAFGKCVSQKAQEGVEAEQQETLNAAKRCKQERGTTAQSRAEFTQRYGGKRNAFGKCVASKTRD